MKPDEPPDEAAGLLLPCPMCGVRDVAILLDLADLEFLCTECDGRFSRADLELIFARWRPVLRWIDAMPKVS